MKAAFCGALVALAEIGIEIALGLDLGFWERMLIVCPLSALAGLTIGGKR